MEDLEAKVDLADLAETLDSEALASEASGVLSASAVVQWDSAVVQALVLEELVWA